VYILIIVERGETKTMQTLQQREEMISRLATDSPCICFNVRKASRAITQVYERMFSRVGLTPSQAMILTSLKMIGPMTVCEVAQAIATDLSRPFVLAFLNIYVPITLQRF